MGHDEPRTGVNRLVGFSDGVFAIAITLLVLNIEVPTVGPNGIASAVFAEWPDVLSYIISFLVIGNYWISHHRIFQQVERQDGRLLWFNLLFLLCIAFVPFPTSLLGESITPVTVSVYAITLVVTGVLSAGLWWYASERAELVSDAVTPTQARDRTVRILAPSVVFALSIPIAWVNPIWAMYFWVMLVAVDPLVDHFFRRFSIR
ncbi:MAG TPA: TMEM175 family protein [Halococcus sp.]|nr:TMEM175 family protein [Halococcus sp.]